MDTRVVEVTELNLEVHSPCRPKCKGPLPSCYMLYRAHPKITGKADSRPAKSPVAGGYAFHKCSDGGDDAYFDTEKRLWRGKGCEQLNSNPH